MSDIMLGRSAKASPQITQMIYPHVARMTYPQISQITQITNGVLTGSGSLFGPDRIRRLVVLRGSESPLHSELAMLMAKHVDLYITGEVHEGGREQSRESGLNLIDGGHYNTERFGWWALGDLIRNELQVEVEFLDFPNEV